MRGDPCADANHAEPHLGMGKALKSPFFDGVDGDDGAAPDRCGHQRRQHAGVVGARILPDDEDAIGLVEVGQLHRAFADADGGHHAASAGLVAHV